MQRHKGNSGPGFLLLIAIVSTTIAVILLSQQSSALSAGEAEQGNLSSPATVDAMPIQLRPGIEGIALIDKDNYTICIYQYQSHRPDHERLVLLAARSFRYDIQLEDYNTAEPRPAAIKDLIHQSSQSSEKGYPGHTEGTEAK